MPRRRAVEEADMDASNTQLASRFFWVGLACLPWLWVVNLWYFRGALCSEHASQELKRCKWGIAGASSLLFRPASPQGSSGAQ